MSGNATAGDVKSRDADGFALTPLRAVSARVGPFDWHWAEAHAREIERNWRARRARRPELFDGTVLMCRDWLVRDGVCEAAFFATRYACFIAFRDAGSPDSSVANAFAAIVPYAADGAVLLGAMGAHTANAGQVYFACGTPDAADVRADGRVDLAASAAREFTEETGLALPKEAGLALKGGTGGAPWLLVEGEGQLAFLRPVRFPEAAEPMRAAIEARRRAQDRPELAGIEIVRTRADIDPARMPGFVRAYLRSAFRD